MNLTAPLLNSIGSIGFFSSRIFLPALMTALIIRFGADIPVLKHSPLVQQHIAAHHPAWFTSDASLAALAVLSVLEMAAQKNPEARRLLHEFDSSLKAGMALLTTLGVISATDSQFVKETAHQAGFLAYTPALLSAGGSYAVARVRGATLAVLHEMDHDDSLHLQRLISWGEEAWIAGGMLLLFLYPVFMLLVIAIAVGLLFVAKKYLEAMEEHSRIPCPQCGTSIYPSAMACFHCHAPLVAPHAVGLLGQSKPFASPDPANHPYRLIEKKRCPICATHLKLRIPHQICGTCNHALLTDANERDAYLNYIQNRVPGVLLISAAWSLLPILGMIIGTIYFRIKLVNPFSVYLPLGKRFLLRWGIRLLFLVLVFFQLLPVVGVLAVPIIAIISYLAYRSTFASMAAEPVLFTAPAAADVRTA